VLIVEIHVLSGYLIKINRLAIAEEITASMRFNRVNG